MLQHNRLELAITSRIRLCSSLPSRSFASLAVKNEIPRFVRAAESEPSARQSNRHSNEGHGAVDARWESCYIQKVLRVWFGLLVAAEL